MKNSYSVWKVISFVLALLFTHASFAQTTFSTLEGEPVVMSERVGQGKWILVKIWKSDCGICKQQAPAISEFHDDGLGDRAEVIGVSLDGRAGMAKVRQYEDEVKPSFPSLVGDVYEVASFYTAVAEETFRGTPSYVLFDPDGVITAAQAGPIRIDALKSFIERKEAEKASEPATVSQ